MHPLMAGARLHRIAAALLLLCLAACAEGDEPESAGVEGALREGAAAAAVPDSTRRAVLDAAQAILDAINRSDPALLREVMLPQALIVAAEADGAPGVSTVDQMAGMLDGPPQRFTERMWDPEVRVDGPIASVWAPYDFYRGGTFSHCGVDAFHLIRAGGEWRVQSVVYNRLQPPDCAMHPDGPPDG